MTFKPGLRVRVCLRNERGDPLPVLEGVLEAPVEETDEYWVVRTTDGIRSAFPVQAIVPFSLLELMAEAAAEDGE